MSLTKVTNSMISGACVNVLDYGADPTGVTDSTAAIEAADLAASAGNIGLDGNTVLAENAVYFPPGRYKVTGLTYRGAPWFGAGVAATFIDLYASSGACVNAAGTSNARKILSISDMSFNGSNCTGDVAIGLQLGYNQRSDGALNRIRIDNFPSAAIYFAKPSWVMSFYDVCCSFNANKYGSARTAIAANNALGEQQLLAFNWYNLVLENNGFIGSTVGGGIELSSNVVSQWNFYGGTWEGNYGIAEGQFNDCVGVYIDGLYLEADAASVPNGLVFSGSTFGALANSKIAGQIGMTGVGVIVENSAAIDIKSIYSNIAWVYDIQVTDTAVVTASGLNAILQIEVENGATFTRLQNNRVQLTDAPTIAVNAALGNSFYVTLFDNRTMGAPTNASLGQRILFSIIQNGTTAACTLTWNAIYKMQTWSNTGNIANKISTIQFEYDGTNWVQISPQVPYF